MSKQGKETKPFEYFDSPDGYDILPKMGVLLKPTALTAFACSTIDVILYSHPKGYLQTIGRYIHCGWPIFGATAAFVIGHNLAGSIRHKDDKINWFIGGAAAGSVVGIWRKSVFGGIVASLFFGTLAYGKKYCVENNYDLIIPSNSHVQYGGLRTVRQDWSLMPNKPGNWTTGKQ